jgi:hypothetical protein
MAMGAALDTGSLAPHANVDTVRSFAEDLFRLGRVDIGSHGDPDAQIAQPNVRKTHILKETTAGMLMVRETFDCGFD